MRKPIFCLLLLATLADAPSAMALDNTTDPLAPANQATVEQTTANMAIAKINAASAPDEAKSEADAPASQALSEEEQNTYLNDQNQFEQAQDQAAAQESLELQLGQLKNQIEADEKKLQDDKNRNNTLAIEEDTKQLEFDKHELTLHENRMETSQVHNLDETPSTEYSEAPVPVAIDDVTSNNNILTSEASGTPATARLSSELAQANTAPRLPW